MMKLTSYHEIFLFLYWTVAKVCRLYLELVAYQRSEMPWGRDCHQPHEVFTRHLTKYDVSLYNKNFIR